MANEKLIDFIKTTTNKLETVQENYPYAIIHTHDESENGTVDDNLYIGADRITDNLNLGETDPSGVTRKVGGLDATTFGQLKQRSISEILIDILSPDPTVTSITLNFNEKTLEATETVSLIATVLPANAVDKTITWTSSNHTVASISSTGVVTASGVGSATITATAGNTSASCIITVIPTPVSSVSLSSSSVSLKVGQTTTLSATVSPSNATNKAVTWISSDSSVVSVSGGLIKVLKVSIEPITITASAEGKSDSCIVTVLPTQPTVNVENSISITYSGLTTINDGDTLPSISDITTSIKYGSWSDGTQYAGEVGTVVLNMSPSKWGETGVGGQTYTISGSVDFAAGEVPSDDFGTSQPSLRYPGGTKTSNSIIIKVLEVIRINGYDTNDGDDNKNITEFRTYTFDNLNDVTLYITVPTEIEIPSPVRFRVYVPQELESFEVKQYDDFERDYLIDIPMTYVSDGSYYERTQVYTNTSSTKYKINLRK